jgi:hypothetical protein
VSPVAIVFYAITVTFASFDWIMSLDPHWYSTVFGVYFFSGAFMASLAFLILVLLAFQGSGLLRHTVSTEHYHDLGKLLFGFVVFWAYIAFSQYMLIWYANIPEETVWYMHRMEHGWEIVTWVLVLGHFVLPFFLLLPRSTKRNRLTLLFAGLWLLAMHYVDLYWLVMPAFGSGFHPHLQDLMTLLGVSLVFLGGFALLTKRVALLPVRDPRLAESISFENI